MHPAAVSRTAPASAPPSPGQRASVPWEGLRLGEAEGILTLGDANTTAAYCRFDGDGEVEYLFVASQWRRRGLARWLLGQVEACVGKPLRFREPLSPLGRQLVAAWEARPQLTREGPRRLRRSPGSSARPRRVRAHRTG